MAERSDEPTRHPSARGSLRAMRRFQDAGEKLARNLDASGLSRKASALRGALVIFANTTIEEKRLSENPYSRALLTLYDIVSPPREGDEETPQAGGPVDR